MAKRRSAGAAVVLCCAMTGAAFAEDLAVPSEYRTIAKAMRSADPGDRIVVTGGKWRRVRVSKPGISIVGAGGAVIKGKVIVSGSGAALAGFRIEGPVIVPADADSVRVEDNVLVGAAGIEVAGEHAVVAGNSVGAGGIRTEGGHARISDNSVVSADGAVTPGYGIAALGAGSSVAGNSVRADPLGGLAAILVKGDGVAVTNNVVVVAGTHEVTSGEVRAIDLCGAGGVIADNDVSLSMSAEGIVVYGDAASVTRNSVTSTSGGDAIVIDGSSALVSRNTILESSESSSSGISLIGADIVVSRNSISGGRADGIVLLDSARTSLVSNVVAGALCGINVTAQTTDTTVAGCTATGACMGIVIGGARTSMSDSVFLGNISQDIVVRSPCALPESNQFTTVEGVRPTGPDQTLWMPLVQVHVHND